MSEHTKGPWKVIIHGNEEYPYPLDIMSEDGSRWIARDGTASSLENARLLAAAPDLLEAAKEALHTLDVQASARSEVWASAVREPLRAAIAKAESA